VTKVDSNSENRWKKKSPWLFFRVHRRNRLIISCLPDCQRICPRKISPLVNKMIVLFERKDFPFSKWKLDCLGKQPFFLPSCRSEPVHTAMCGVLSAWRLLINDRPASSSSCDIVSVAPMILTPRSKAALIWLLLQQKRAKRMMDIN